MIRRLTPLLLLLGLLLGNPAQAADFVRIGVLSHRGDAATLRAWTPTADYLNTIFTDYYFEIVPLDFDRVEPAVANGEVDFVLVNPGIYVSLEVRHRVSRIATLNNRRNDVPYNIFGGVIFTRTDRTDLTWLSDLAGKRLAAVDPTSLGGYQMAWREMAAQGIDIHRDLAELRFAGTHDRVVLMVRDSEVDAGTVRTDILERMARDGVINLNDYRILNPQQDSEFPFIHSTRLYPEWPLGKVAHTSNQLAQEVAIALLQIPQDHPAAIRGNYAGWTVPLDYQPVHALFRELNLPPYDDAGRFTLADVVRSYWLWILSIMLALFALLLMSSWAWRLNLQLQRAQRLLKQRHELILDSVGDGIYGVDLEGNCTFVNRAMEQISGWSNDDLIGYNQHHLLHHTRADGTPFPGNDCPVYHTFRDSSPRFIADDIFWRKDGSSFPVEYSSTPVRDERGETVGAVVVFRDITERKAAEEEQRQHQAEFAHMARVSTMGEMASGIAHEINQPLAAIANYLRGSIRMLHADNPNHGQIILAMERAAEQSDRAGEIIRQLRRFIRKERPERSHVDLNQIVKEVVLLVIPEANKARVSIDLDLDPELPRIQAQLIQIEQVILNLARNAIDAMAEGDQENRQLTIATTPVKEGVWLCVNDTGPGISNEQQERIFDPFVTTKQRGMGLGLSISRGIIDAHQGRLWLAASGPGSTTFCLSLPTNPSDEEPDHEQ